MLKRIRNLALISIMSVVTATSCAASSDTAQDLKGVNVVLVHGAFAGGSSWNKVIPLLEAYGAHVVAIQNSLRSLKDDADAAERAIDQQQGPVVLVGHSWGGVVITETGDNPKVKALVYVAALAPESKHSVNDILRDKPAPSSASQLKNDAAGYLTLTPSAIRNDFAQDLPASESKLIADTQGPWYYAALEDKVSNAAWRSKPSTFLVTSMDHMIDPRLQEAMAKQIGATVAHADASHAVLLSQPAAVADAIISAARKVQP